MNDLGAKVLEAMERSALGRMSIYILSKQSMDLGIDMDDMGRDDVAKLAERMRSVLPFFLGEDADSVINQIRRISSQEAAR